MQPTYSKEAEAFREKVQAFLGEHLPENWKGIGALPADEAYTFTNNEWRPLLAEHRFLAPAWPRIHAKHCEAIRDASVFFFNIMKEIVEPHLGLPQGEVQTVWRNFGASVSVFVGRSA